jgi:hypothetical protein
MKNKEKDKLQVSVAVIEQHVLNTNAGKQLSCAATDIKLTLVLKI